MNIGIVIKEIRKQKGITQLELSEHASLSERTIQRIENDEVEPSFYSLKNIGEILDVDLLEIRAKNSTMLTSKILGIHLNDLTMNQAENQDLEQRLEKIESHLASIARNRNIQLRNRNRIWIVAGIFVGVVILTELFVLLGIIG
jgi:transcriptional regulator with XRE-family HTH domain